MSQADIDAINKACNKRSLLNPVRWLLRIGFVRPNVDKVIDLDAGAIVEYHSLRWPFRIGPWWVFKTQVKTIFRQDPYLKPIGLFRNLPHIVRDVGTWLPRRWGFTFFTFEFGQRG